MKSEIKEKIDFKKLLGEEAKKNNIEISKEKLIKFEMYKDLILEWNEKINLTAITDEYEMVLKHFVDSLECVKYIKEEQTVIDIGTGAGFPGIVLSIFFNGKLKITLLDALNKRLIFLQEAIDKLNLKNVWIVHGRAEEMAQKKEYREKFDVAVSRAVANLPILLEYDIPYVKIGGKCLLMKNDTADEINSSKNALNILNCKISNIYKYSYDVRDEKYTRDIVEVVKTGQTPNKYPRNFGKIKKSPL